MGIGTDVYRTLRYEGDGCAHDVVLCAGRPSYSNADQGAADAADAFVDSALEHLRRWWEEWRLPALCHAGHAVVLDVRDEGGGAFSDADVDALDGPGFRWVEITLPDGSSGRAYLVADAARDGYLNGP